MKNILQSPIYTDDIKSGIPWPSGFDVFGYNFFGFNVFDFNVFISFRWFSVYDDPVLIYPACITQPRTFILTHFYDLLNFQFHRCSVESTAPWLHACRIPTFRRHAYWLLDKHDMFFACMWNYDRIFFSHISNPTRLWYSYTNFRYQIFNLGRVTTNECDHKVTWPSGCSTIREAWLSGAWLPGRPGQDGAWQSGRHGL